MNAAPQAPQRLYLLQLAIREPQGIAAPGYLIQTGDGKNVLIDTGWPKSMIGAYKQGDPRGVRIIQCSGRGSRKRRSSTLKSIGRAFTGNNCQGRYSSATLPCPRGCNWLDVSFSIRETSFSRNCIVQSTSACHRSARCCITCNANSL